MQLSSKKGFALALTVLALSLPEIAASAPLRTATVRGDFSKLAQLSDQVSTLADESDKIQLSSPISISGNVPKLGRFKGSLTTRKLFRGTPFANTFFVQGDARQSQGRVFDSAPVFATSTRRDDGGWKIELFVVNSATKPRYSRNHSLYQLTLDVDSKGVLRNPRLRSSRKELSKRVCTDHGTTDSIKASNTDGDIRASGTNGNVAVLVEVDQEFAGKVTNAATESATILNGVDVIYQRDLGVGVTATIVAEAQNYSTALTLNSYSQSFPLHDEMRQHRPAAARSEYIHYLMTGKNPIGSDIRYLAGAVPDLGTICRDKSYSIGFTIRYSTTDDILTTAHEMGHLFGGEHDDQQTAGGEPGIMNSGTEIINGDITRFSAFSKQQIGTFLSQYGSCLGSGTVPTPQPTPETPVVDPKDGLDDGSDDTDELALIVDLFEPRRDLRASTTTLKAELYDEEEYVYTGESLVLICTNNAQRVVVTKTATTNRNGVASFKVPRPSSRNITCYAYYNDLSISDPIRVAARKRR